MAQTGHQTQFENCQSTEPDAQPPQVSSLSTENRPDHRALWRQQQYMHAIDLSSDPPRVNPKRVTGVHRDIRTTSTDGDRLTLPGPYHDDPQEDLPGEAENPHRDFDEEIIEDAYED